MVCSQDIRGSACIVELVEGESSSYNYSCSSMEYHMNGLTTLQRVRLNAILFQHAEGGSTSGLKSLFNQVYLCTGSAEIALEAIRNKGKKRGNRRNFAKQHPILFKV